MGQFKGNQLTDRLEAGAKAREETLSRFRARPPADDPAVLARQAERQAVAEARDIREREREESRIATEAVRAEEAAEEKARAAAEIVRQAAEKVERQAALAAEQKAVRDARFAARKAKVRR